MALVDSKINALLTLLGDDDEKIRKVARKKLLSCGEDVIPALRKIGKQDCAGLLRIEVQRLLEEHRLRKLAERFVELNRGNELDLEEATFLLAQIEYPELDVAYYKGKIDTLAEEFQKKVLSVGNNRKRVERLSHFLFQEKGFRGNFEEYYDPDNSYINRVLDRYVGIPISLSSVCLFVAKRLSLPVRGVGFPGHFLLKYEVDAEPLLFDPFNKGRILTRADCKEFLAKMGYSFHDFYLCSATSRDILSRMIRNLVLIYLENNEPAKIETLERIFSDFIME